MNIVGGDFLDNLAQFYGAGMHVLDFIGAPEASRGIINGWVSDQTEAAIPELLPKGSIDSDVRFVLTNAVYFNAAWLHKFDSDNTVTGDFTKLDGSTVSASLMKQTEEFPYVDADGYFAVQLPYDGYEIAMVVLVPDAGSFDTVESGLTASFVKDLQAALQTTNMNLTFPRFEYRQQVSLATTLQAMGMSAAFSAGAADFSGIDGTKNLFIADVIHEGFVKVNEEGTEAAAATAVIGKATSAPPPPIEVAVDRPFLFFIRDLETGAVIFVGRVVDPTE